MTNRQFLIASFRPRPKVRVMSVIARQKPPYWLGWPGTSYDVEGERARYTWAITDSTFDTSRNEVIHAHCVAATRMRGIGGPACPYILRSHMEDNKGVSVQVEMPVHETITGEKFSNPTTPLISTAEVTGSIDGPRGCRM